MKAIALISGGLDSMLSARIIEEEGIEVIKVNFKIPFCHLKPKSISTPDQNVRIIDISEKFIDLIKNPSHGFGSNMNPCLDCKILMLKEAKELLGQWGASFVVTGEVLGQRPMSQHRRGLKLIAEESGLQGLLLRPLSAGLLDESIPEKEGWIRKNALLKFNGRSRRPQIELAKHFGIKEYPNAAGGCLLTDKNFSNRLRDLIKYGQLTLRNIELLKFGRHFRLNNDAKLVVGRDEYENIQIEKLAQDQDHLFLPTDDFAGPTSLGRGKFDSDLLRIAGEITSYYCDRNLKSKADITYRKMPDEKPAILSFAPILEETITTIRI